MKYAIFIKTFKRDIPWLQLCLRGIVKFCSGFSEIVIVAPSKEKEDFDKLGLTMERIEYRDEPIADGYIWQQVVKLHADEYTDADYILFVDSDCIFHALANPLSFLKDGKPYVLYTAYKSLGPEVPWQAGSEFTLKCKVPYEFMRRFPLMFHRSTLVGIRNHISSNFGVSCRDFMIEHGRSRYISEFNIMGAYAYFFQNSEYHWINTETDTMPPVYLRQFWSYGGLDGIENVQDVKRMKELL